ncbi:MAG TPA: DEAD/DEAH box helicase [Erysipelothrix sp.]
MKFEVLKLSETILNAIKEKGYSSATEVQEKSIPLILTGVDVLVQSQTGTGKTAAFSLPLIQKIVDEGSTRGLILCPTRELAIQVSQEIREYAMFNKEISVATVYGGEDIRRQIKQLKNKPQIIVATPGRLMDHLNRKTVSLQDFSYVVLDEADEMLNMGFIDDIRLIFSHLPKQVQFAFFSATMPQPIVALAKEFLTDVNIVKFKQQSMTVDRIDQYYYQIKHQDKQELLFQLLTLHAENTAIIFSNTKRMVDDLEGAMTQKGIKSVALHGDMEQRQRDLVMKRFKNGEARILIATDVAARGIDVPEVDLVINYDLPQEDEFYIHRIGRTGRAGRQGVAVSLVGPRDRNRIRSIERVIKKKITKREVPTQKELDYAIKSAFVDHLDKKRPYPKKEFSRFMDEIFNEGYDAHEVLELFLLDFFLEHRQTALKEKSNESGNYVKLKINVGRTHGVHVADLLKFIHQETGVNQRRIGKIILRKKETIIEVAKDQIDSFISGMTNKKYKNRRLTVSK